MVVMRKVSQETSVSNLRVGPKAHRACMSQDSAEKHQQQGGWVDGWMERWMDGQTGRQADWQTDNSNLTDTPRNAVVPALWGIL